MNELILLALDVLASHGYLVVFAWMFADQAALPLPAIPLLIAAGAVAATGPLDVAIVISVATVATLLADSLWYLLGRRGGAKAIYLICRLSIEPDSCVTTTRKAFGRLGPGALVFAKYLPGVQTLAPASVGIARAPWLGFLALDLVGTLLFVVPFVGIGYLFQPQLFAIAAEISQITGAVTFVAVAIASLYAGVKVMQWIVFFRGHRLRRITPESLYERLEAGTPTTVIDLRQRFDYELVPEIVPGATRIPLDEVPKRHEEIPRSHEIVLVCT